MYGYSVREVYRLCYAKSNDSFSYQSRMSSAAWWGMTYRGCAGLTRSASSKTLTSVSSLTLLETGVYFQENADAKGSLEVALVSVW